MPITNWKVENYMRVKLVHFQPGPGITEITGENGVGKSSLMAAAQALLEGGKEIAWKPIRDGAESAVISMDITGGEPAFLRATRTIKKNKKSGEIVTSLIVENEDGAKYDKPVEKLKALINVNSFDPLLFIRSPAKDQLTILQKFVPDVDFSAIHKLNDADFEKRTIVNRDAKARRAQADGVTFDADLGSERVDEAVLLAQLESASGHNAGIERERNRRDNLKTGAERLQASAAHDRTRVADFRAQADALELVAIDKERQAKAFTDEVSEAGQMPAPIDSSQIRLDIEAARATNAKIDANERKKAEHTRLSAEADALWEQAALLTDSIDNRNEDREAAIANVKMPIDGLSFGDGMVMFNGQPLDQASSAEQIRVSVAIAAALNPKLKIAFIRDGSLLDHKSWELLRLFAEQHQLQVFVETVDSDRANAIVIEDGTIRSAAQQAAE